MAEQLAYNMDCLEAMREMPDNAFDLAVVDPPYGSDGCKGAIVGRFGGMFSKYHLGDSQSVQVERERAVGRTGGTWAKKYQRERQGRRVRI